MDDQNIDGDGRQDYGAQLKVDVPAIGITLQYPLDEGAGRGLVFQTYVAADCKQSDLNEALDKVRIAADRQRAIVCLPTLRGLLSDSEAALKGEVTKHYEIETMRDQTNNRRSQAEQASGRRNLKPGAMDVAEDARTDAALTSCKANMTALKARIVIDKRKIEDAEKLIAAGA